MRWCSCCFESGGRDDRSDWLKETEVEMSGKHYYTDEKNAQIVIVLLKAYGIKHLILSPGGDE